MSEFDLANFFQNNLGSILPSASLIVSNVISALYLQKKTHIATRTQEFEKLKAEKIDDVLNQMLSSGELSYTELYRINNYIKIAKRADKFVQTKKKDEKVPKQDFDWHIRFFENCGNVGNEELQEYWAKILAGEINHPGTYSYRTLECLKNLSHDEAMIFQKICRASFDMGKSVILPQYDSIFRKYEIAFDDVLKAEDCGLIKSDNWIDGTFAVEEEYKIITHNSEQALMAKQRESIANEKNNVIIQQYLFTRSGKELYRMLGNQADVEILHTELTKSYPQFIFRVGKITGKEGDKLLVDDGED